MSTTNVTMGGWQTSGLRLSAPDGVLTPAQLLDFARRVAAELPDEVVVIEEYGLRAVRSVADVEGVNLMPRLEWTPAV